MNPECNLDHPSCIGEKAFLRIEQILKGLRPRRIIEYGSGRSTLRLTQAFSEAVIESYDHEETYAAHTRSLLAKYGGAARAEVVVAPLRIRCFGPSLYWTYRKQSCSQPADCVIIDGPPTGVTVRGREACLYMAYDRLRIGGVVVLDDYSREDEKKILSNWTSVYPGSFEIEIISENHGLAVLKKIKEVKPRWFTVSRGIDNARSVLVLLKRRIRSAIPDRCVDGIKSCLNLKKAKSL